MKTILCPVDFSANSDNAVRYVLEMNEVLNAKIILLHIFETPVLYGDAVPFTIQLDFQSMHDAAAKKLKAFRRKYFTENYPVDMMLQQGLASHRICEIAIEKKVDTIVMGATGAAKQILLGSNAIRVANKAHCKVMLIPAKAKFEGLEKMVYATDLTDDNLLQARELFPMAEIFNTELMFLYIEKEFLEPDKEILNKVTAKIKTFISYSKKSGFVCTDDSTLDGVTYFLKKNKADCLVVFHRHRNLLQSLFKPSISKKISLHASIPVMILHEDDLVIRD